MLAVMKRAPQPTSFFRPGHLWCIINCLNWITLCVPCAAGFLSYDEFQSQALGVGAATHAVTGLFWLAVLLLVG